MTAIPIDDYFASVEARFESPSPYGRKEITVEALKHACECGKTFDTEQGLRVHKGRAHGKTAHTPPANHPWRSSAVMPSVAPEQKLNEGEEPLPDEHVTMDEYIREGFMSTPDYRMELIETLAELATWEVTLDDSGPVQSTLARIKAVARCA